MPMLMNALAEARGRCSVSSSFFPPPYFVKQYLPLNLKFAVQLDWFPSTDPVPTALYTGVIDV